MSFHKSYIEELYNRYAQRLYFTSLRITANSFEAEEVMHDTFMKYHTFHKKETIDNIEKWLTSVCIRKSIDVLRARKKEEIMFECTECCEDESDTENVKYTVEKIREALAKLPDGYRIILTLHLFEGYDYSEIAQITNLKESSVRSQYMRAKNRLAATLKEL